MAFFNRLVFTPTRAIVTGCMLILLSAMGGVYFASFPGPTPLDRLAERVLPNEWYNPVLIWIVAHGLPIALVLGAVLSFVLAWSWDRRRALTCLLAPGVAIAIAHYVMKPLVGRVINPAVSGLGYPSGHMSATAAVVAAGVLAVPAGWRRRALVVGTAVDVSVAILLILIRWHYATDLLGGAALAIGVTLLIDGALHLIPVPSVSAGASPDGFLTRPGPSRPNSRN